MMVCAEITWTLQPFSDLTPETLHMIYAARQEVFVVEQDCVYQDADDYDPQSHHLCAWKHCPDGNQQMLAYMRIVPPCKKFTEPSLGRILTTTAGRGQGLGKKLLQEGIIATRTLYPNQPIRISAQHYLEKFYQGFGFVTVSDVYLEDGIPHINMLLSSHKDP